MIEIKTLEIAGMASVLQALRLPFGLECRSKCDTSHYRFPTEENAETIEFNTRSECHIHEKDLRLLSTLIRRGDEHAKAIRGLIVYAEINAPLSFWSEADTYRIGTDRLSSESTMHTIGNGGLTIHNFSAPPIIREVLSEKEVKPRNISHLRFDTPSELKCVVKEYFGRQYEIWNNGDIYSLPYETDEILPNGAKRCKHFEKSKVRIGKARNHQGYYQVRLGGRRGKTMTVHRVFADAFVPNPNGYNVVNHKDGNKGNCSIDNLEWCTSSDNNKHAYDIGLKEKTLREKYQHYKDNLRWSDEDVESWVQMRKDGLSLQEISERSGAGVSIICQYTNGKRYEDVSEHSAWFSLAKKYEDLIAEINDLSALYQDTGDFEYVIRIKELLPTSFMQRRIQYFSYQTLRRIYHQRITHRLPHWRKFCEWIETLPFFDELILSHNEN